MLPIRKLVGKGCAVEVACLLTKFHSASNIEVELKMNGMDLAVTESKAAYEEIKAYVKEKDGFAG